MIWLLIGSALMALAFAVLIKHCSKACEMVADALTDDSHMDTEGSADE